MWNILVRALERGGEGGLSKVIHADITFVQLCITTIHTNYIHSDFNLIIRPEGPIFGFCDSILFLRFFIRTKTWNLHNLSKPSPSLLENLSIPQTHRLLSKFDGHQRPSSTSPHYFFFITSEPAAAAAANKLLPSCWRLSASRTHFFQINFDKSCHGQNGNAAHRRSKGNFTKRRVVLLEFSFIWIGGSRVCWKGLEFKRWTVSILTHNCYSYFDGSQSAEQGTF